MAAESEIRAMEIYWTRDDSEISDEELVKVPGLKATGNRRLVKKQVKGRKTKEVRAAIPVKQPKVQNLISAKDVHPSEELNHQSGKETNNHHHQRKASLKDLRPEDKKRVADLISELARAGEQRESALQLLEHERATFDAEITTLLNQQEQVLKDREVVQQQLFECQRLLALYQQQVVEAQQKIARSAAKIAQASGSPKSHKLERTRDVSQSDLPLKHDNELEFNADKFEAFTRQNSNFQPDSLQPQVELYEDQQEEFHFRPVPTFYSQPLHNGSSLSTGEVQSAKTPPNEPETWEITPGGTRRLRVTAPSSPSNRPFTKRIDRLIEAERSSPTRKGEPVELQNVGANKISDKPLIVEQKLKPRDRLLELGPLNPPVLSSTIKSDATSACGSVVPPVASGHNEFRPLVPDPETLSGQSNSSEYRNGQARYQSSKVGFNQQLETYMPYKEDAKQEHQGANDPRQDLLVQKEALLEEQKQLKAILEQQEELLQERQQELHKQQLQHRERLMYFQQTGQFPAGNGNLVQTSPHSWVDQAVRNDNLPYTKPGLPSSETVVCNAAFLSDRKPIEPYPGAPVPPVRSTEHQTFSPYRQDLNPRDGVSLSYRKHPESRPAANQPTQHVEQDIEQVLGVLDQLHPRDIDTGVSHVTGAIEELHLPTYNIHTHPGKDPYVQKKGHRVGKFRHDEYKSKNEKSQENRPCGIRASTSSPRKKMTGNMAALKNHRGPGKVQAAASKNMKKGKQHRKPFESSDSTPFLTGDQAAQLLNILEEVESAGSHASSYINYSPSSCPLSPTHHLHNTSCHRGHQELSETQTSEEESRLLEEVFFVH